MKNLIAAGFIVLLASACTSQITTENTLITTLYLAEKPTVMADYEKVIQSMDKYEIKSSSENQILVKYDPDGLLMGSASVQADFNITSGLTIDGLRTTGVEIIYTDMTGFWSQDTSFGGADIIDRITSSVNEYMKFKEVEYLQVTIR